MKTSLIITAAALAVLVPASRALPPEIEEAREQALEAHQRAFGIVKEIRDTLVPAPIVRFVEEFPPIAEPRRRVLQLAQRTPPGTLPAPTPAPPVAPGAPGAPVGVSLGPDEEAISAWANDFAISTAKGAIGGIFGEGKSAKRPVIVGADTKSIAAIEEDLNVMLRIIDKAAGGRDEKATAMGVPLDVFNLSGSSSSPRAFYLDGYGAMFLTKVKFPLLAPAKAEETGTNDTTNSEWERARQEVYGGRSPEAHNAYYPPAGEPFDEQRVENLKTQLIGDLANATHIRNLKPDEAVTVVVLGSSRAGSAHNNRTGQQMRAYAGAGIGGNGRSIAWQASRDSGTQTTMTLRAKKSDVDAFAKGKLNSEEFRKKVSVQIY